MDFQLKDYLTAPLQLLRTGRWMKKAPYLEQKEMERQLLDQLRELCEYAYVHVPFYREWFDIAGFCPAKLTSFAYFERLPILTKDIVRQNYSRLISDELPKLGAVDCETSGSTGTPLHFLLDKNVNAARLSLFYRTWKKAPHWRLGRAQATISGYADGKWKYSHLSKILYLSSFHLSEKTIREYYDLLLRYNVKFIRGYPSSLYRFAELLNDHDLHLHFDVMFSGAETLLPYQRTYIEDTFGGKLIDHYTHWESTASICECMQGNLHAENDFGYHEIVDASNRSLKQGVGRLICTGLYNRAMPLIRYDTRDLAEWAPPGQCICGSNFPIIKRIVGRIEDIVYTPDGKKIGRLDAAFKYNKNIKLAYIYQPSIEKIIVNIYPSNDFNYKKETALLDTELRKRVGQDMDILYRTVGSDELPYTKAGKIRFVVSEVHKEEQTTNQRDASFYTDIPY